MGGTNHKFFKDIINFIVYNNYLKLLKFNMILEDSFLKFFLLLISPRRISMTSSCCPFLCNAKKS